MNYFTLSLCCMLIGLTAGQPFQPTPPPQPLQDLQPDETSGSDTKREKCLVEVRDFLSEIRDVLNDPSVTKLIDEALELDLSLDHFMHGRYIPLHANDDLALKRTGYPAPCDRILRHFSDIREKKHCFREESMGTGEDYEELAEDENTRPVIYAGLLCSYAAKWREGGGGESASPFDFNQNKKDCLREAAASLSEVPFDDTLEEVLKLTRDSQVSIVDFIYIDDQPLDQKYVDALMEINARSGCNNFLEEMSRSIASVECYAEQIEDDTLAGVELLTMGKFGDRALAARVCDLMGEYCSHEVANFLSNISLDESVMQLVEQSRKLGLTHVHFQAALYEPLDDGDNEELFKSGYPESCAKVEEQFSEMDEKVKCADVKSWDILNDWMTIANDEQAGDVVLARWACLYASKLEEESLGVKPREPVEISDSEKERKNYIIAAAEQYRQITLHPQIQELVKELHACKIRMVDLRMLREYQPMDIECDRAFREIDLQQVCQELESNLKPIENTVEFYKKGLSEDPNNYFELMSQDGVGDILLADEACAYILEQVADKGQETSELKQDDGPIAAE